MVYVSVIVAGQQGWGQKQLGQWLGQCMGLIGPGGGLGVGCVRTVVLV